MGLGRDGPKPVVSRCTNGTTIRWSRRRVRAPAGGTSRPITLAVLRLITVSYLVGACTGRSPGFSPLRMRIDVAGGAYRSRVRGRERALILQGVRNRQAGWRRFPGCACR